ncbi:MAG: endonuclease domain-containing protein [Candidatus Magasanikbacteria bacterium]|nr:endonuclease domain-containing protein [Candidatus Magasanikbacteria bacterium]
MKFVPYSNQKEYKSLRVALRKTQTDAEELLWAYLRNKRAGFKFRRQHGIGNYIVDFYCHRSKVIIEIDGFVHEDDGVFEKDKIRQGELERLGFKVLRYTNKQVYKNLRGVWYHIIEECKQRCGPLTPSRTSPS